MTLDYIYHSGFAIEMEGVTVIIDYYKDSSETEHNRGLVHDYLLQRPGKLYVYGNGCIPSRHPSGRPTRWMHIAVWVYG